MTELETMGSLAKKASRALAAANAEKKNEALFAIADILEKNADKWLFANALDIKEAEKNGMPLSLQDRLRLTPERVSAIAQSVRDVAALPDPTGIVLSEVLRPNGLRIDKVSVPIGVVGIIYEARPNVTVDAAAISLKSGNASILRGGKEAINSNLCVIELIRDAIESAGLPRDCTALVKSTDRSSAKELMELTEYLDVLIPRGGPGLIRSVVQNSRVPTIHTGEGVCHVYVDEESDLELGAKVLYNAKCSRPSVCNAAECLIVHKKVAEAFMNEAMPLLKEKNVEIRGDAKIQNIFGTEVKEASEEDWDTEYGDYILAVKTVSSLDEAIDFINQHGTGHSEAIITTDPDKAARFLNEVDAAAVYVNASTRFTDGGEFGMGAEIGISTQKLHARGPMGLREMTSYKYIVYGEGQVR
ncbi:MAG: glutamate-5-semialdehyde dehydrogenase [Oscillospiraceae bacterium]|nr:glutamate-5-semialdehyde dehydrogenase [Oscillospiraceae bacterium]MBQ5503795.1 glutamate-5-semialdehyde dehydrogenase [Oscillospiraceae bacterium]